MSQQLLTTGIKINVDATDLDIKFAKSADALNKTLTKSQKALGLFYDAQGRLVNSTGKVVEGLSQSQIKLGQYVDELGRTRSFQGGFVDGLNASQKALGMFKDELGNVYDRLGNLIIESERAKRALENVDDVASTNATKALDDMAAAAQSARSGLGALGGQFATVFSQIATASGGFDDFTAAVSAAGQGVAVFTASYDAFSNISKYITAATTAINAQRTATIAATGAQTAFNVAANANPYVLAASAILAVASAAATYFSAVDDGANSATSRLDELVESAKKAGIEIKTAFDIAKYGAESYNPAADTYKQRLADLERAQAGVKAWEAYESQAASVAIASYAPGAHATDEQYASLRALREEAAEFAADKDAALKALDDATTAFQSAQNALFDRATEQTKTEAARIRDEIAQYEELRKAAEGTDNEGAVNAYLARLRADLAAAEQRELDEKAAPERDAEEKERKANEAALKELDFEGLAKAAAPVQTELERLEALSKKWSAAVESGAVSSEQYAQATANLATLREREEKRLADEAAKKAEEEKANKRADLGISAALDEVAKSKADEEAARVAALTPDARYQEAVKKYAGALQDGTITQAEYNDLTTYALKVKEKEIKAEAEALEKEREEERARVEKERADLRKDSGIDALIESLKSPYEKYLDKLDGINNYLARGAVTSAEAQLLAEQAYMEAEQAYLDASNGANSKLGQALAKPVATAKDGSAELYKMQLAQQNDKTAQMIAVQKEVLSSSQNMALYMFNMQRDIAMMATGWPGYYRG